jgi:hypothetical protein
MQASTVKEFLKIPGPPRSRDAARCLALIYWIKVYGRFPSDQEGAAMRKGIEIEVTAADGRRLEAIVADRDRPPRHVS